MKFSLLASASSLAMGSLVLIGMPGAAEATLSCSAITFSCTETVTPGSFLVNSSQTATLDFFTPGSGQALTSVVISETGSFATTGTITYTGGGIGGFTFNSVGTLNLLSGAGAPAGFPSLSTSANATKQTYSLSFGQSASYNGSKAFATASATLTGGVLAGFVGSGTFLVDFTNSGGIGVSGTSSVATDLSSLFFPTVSLTYNYSIPAPEPASLAVLGAGLAGLGVARRRRKIV